MEWTPGDTSQDIEDRRGESGGDSSGGGFGGGGFGLPHLGIGGLLLVGVLSLVFHQNFFALFSGGGSSYQTQSQVQANRAPAPVNTRPGHPADRELQFISFVLDDVQNTWAKLLPEQANIPYRHAKLVTFRDSWPSPCGTAGDATGPFYCPADEKVYLDFGFFDELKSRFGGSNAEFAQAYVVAHELGHHVQKILGIESKVTRLQQQHPSEANPLSVDVELQADCFAGVWGHSAAQRNIIDTTDVQAAMSAAAAVGDDRLQRMATGHVSPEKFTHGSAQQRTHWLQRGLDSGNISACNTFRNQP
jgi:predicted metalloprotease